MVHAVESKADHVVLVRMIPLYSALLLYSGWRGVQSTRSSQLHLGAYGVRSIV